jgi:hypothetical protein
MPGGRHDASGEVDGEGRALISPRAIRCPRTTLLTDLASLTQTLKRRAQPRDQRKREAGRVSMSPQSGRG